MTDTYIPLLDHPAKVFILALAKREACGEDESPVTQAAKRVLRASAVPEPSPYVVELEGIAREVKAFRLRSGPTLELVQDVPRNADGTERARGKEWPGSAA